MGPLRRLFLISGYVCPGFQSQGGSLLHADVSTSIGGGLGLKSTTICGTGSKHGTVYHSVPLQKLKKL